MKTFQVLRYYSILMQLFILRKFNCFILLDHNLDKSPDDMIEIFKKDARLYANKSAKVALDELQLLFSYCNLLGLSEKVIKVLLSYDNFHFKRFFFRLFSIQV